MRSLLLLLAALVLSAPGLGACRPAATPAPETPGTEPAPPTVAATVAVSTAPATAALTATPPGWQEHRIAELTLQLPVGWREDRSTTASWSAFEQTNPELAGYAGGDEARGATVFSARGRAGGTAGAADSLNVRRTALDREGAARLPAIAGNVVDQYSTLGFEVQEVATGLEIGGMPAARIVISYTAKAREGKAQEFVALQLLAAAPDTLWILTYTTAEDRFTAMREAFEQSVESVRVR